MSVTTSEIYLSEARIRLTKAEKRLKSRLLFLRKSRRLALSAKDFCRAGILFHNGGIPEESQKAFSSASDCYKKMKAWYSAAKALEQAMVIAAQQNDYEGLLELSWRTAALYDKSHQPDHAASILARSGFVLRHKFPEDYLKMLYKAAEIVTIENRLAQAAIYLKGILSIHIYEDRIQEAIHVAQKIVDLYVETDQNVNLWRMIQNLSFLHLSLGEKEKVDVLLNEFKSLKSLDVEGHESLSALSEAFEIPANCIKVEKGLAILNSGSLHPFFAGTSLVAEKLRSVSNVCSENSPPSKSETDFAMVSSIACCDDPRIQTNLIHPLSKVCVSSSSNEDGKSTTDIGLKRSFSTPYG